MGRNVCYQRAKMERGSQRTTALRRRGYEREGDEGTMIRLMDPSMVAQLPTIDLPTTTGQADTSCQRCEAFRPAPDPTGSLAVDPEIHLPSPGMDVDIAYFYNANSQANGPFGYSRTLSTNLTALISGSPARVTLTRGNGAQVVYQADMAGNFTPQTPGVLNTLTTDVSSGSLLETTPDGHVYAYPLSPTGVANPIQWASDAVGNTHNFVYSGGLLQNLMDAVGRKVTFLYAGGLLQTIQDWAGRLTTFQYDTASVPGKALLATVIGPTGCQTAYQYNNVPLLTGITNPNGYQTGYQYDALNRVLARSVSGSGLTSYSYAPGLMVVVDALGNVLTQTLDSNSQIVGMVNALGQSITATRNANTQETSRQDPLGGLTTTVYKGVVRWKTRSNTQSHSQQGSRIRCRGCLYRTPRRRRKSQGGCLRI